jgi:hypothetical protein
LNGGTDVQVAAQGGVLSATGSGGAVLSTPAALSLLSTGTGGGADATLATASGNVFLTSNGAATQMYVYGAGGVSVGAGGGPTCSGGSVLTTAPSGGSIQGVAGGTASLALLSTSSPTTSFPPGGLSALESGSVLNRGDIAVSVTAGSSVYLGASGEGAGTVSRMPPWWILPPSSSLYLHGMLMVNFQGI